VVAYNKVQRQLPYLLYLQGGPGFEAPRPTEASGWLKAATNHFRVLLLDQRGTGRSSAITPLTLQKQGGPEAQAKYLKYFRADSIVADCEVLRQILVPVSNQGGKWSLLGQSFGGFCCLSYLSYAPHGLTEVMLTGGVPPLVTEQCGAEEVYRSLFQVSCGRKRMISFLLRGLFATRAIISSLRGV
jgi:pimeloyl-ACP methyl ester carboxylesterase